jgi:hypothetical protein
MVIFHSYVSLPEGMGENIQIWENRPQIDVPSGERLANPSNGGFGRT